jgi:hypothetical protein
MRESYDCLVIGRGPAASVFAHVAAEAGARVAMLDPPRSARTALSDWINFWLVPLDDEADVGARLRMDRPALFRHAIRAMDVACVENGSERIVRCALYDAAEFTARCQLIAEGLPNVDRLPRVALEHYLYAGERVVGVQASTARSVERWEMLAPVVVDTTRSTTPVDVRPAEYGLFDAVVWGRYRGVTLLESSASASTFPGRAGSRFWLLPISASETHVGVEVARQPAARLASVAQLWEDELVGCPAMADRLMNAHLIEASQLQRACFPHGPCPAQPGLLPLDELTTASPLAFQWSVLGRAVRLAESVLQDAVSKRQLTGG